MSLRNQEKCFYLRRKGVAPAQNGYSASLLGHQGCYPIDLDKCNEIKRICLECPIYPKPCIYDKMDKEREIK